MTGILQFKTARGDVVSVEVEFDFYAPDFDLNACACRTLVLEKWAKQAGMLNDAEMLNYPTTRALRARLKEASGVDLRVVQRECNNKGRAQMIDYGAYFSNIELRERMNALR